MPMFTTSTIRITIAVAALAAIGMGLGAGAGPGRPAWCDEPAAEAAVFSHPTDITNLHAPFVVGAVHVYTNVERGVTEIEILTHTAATREFQWNGTAVTCRVADEVEFVGGVLVSRGKVFLAQADDGSVWAFGDVDEIDDDDEDDDEDPDEDGWVVGSRAPSDPERIAENLAPSLLMPGVPTVGAVWTTHDGAHDRAERRVVATDEGVRLPSGRFESCLRIREEPSDGDPVRQIQCAPGIGLVRARSSSERTMLRGSTLLRRR